MRRTLVIALMTLAGNVPNIDGQTTSGTFTGIVTDVSKQVVPRAEVTAINQATGLTRKTISNEVGEYTIAFLPTGLYTLQTGLAGFKSQVLRDVRLDVQRSIRVDFQLEVGELSETMNVEAQAPLLETEKTDTGTVVSSEQVSTLPLNVREFMQMVYLAPFTVEASRDYRSAANSSVRQTGVPSGAGARPEDSNYQIDGFENREASLNNVSVLPSVETVAEFRVQVGTADSSFGRSPGSLINVVTKSGTNSFHGSLYDYLRNDLFDARPFFAADKSPLKRNQFGGSLGGPILKDKLLFFVNYEGLEQRAGGSPTIGLVPTEEQRRGLFSTLIRDPFTGQEFPKVGDRWQIPADRTNPISQQMLQYWPLPNYASGNLANYRFESGSVPINRKNLSFRGDHNIGSNDSLYLRYIWNDDSIVTPGRFPNQAGEAITDLGAWTVSGHHNHVFSPKLVNDFGLSFMRYETTNQNPRSFGENIHKTIGITNTLGDSVPGATGIPSISMPGYLNPGDSGYGNQFTHVYELIDNLALQRGSHLFKFGGSIRATSQDIFWTWTPGDHTFSNAYSGDNFSDFLLGVPSGIYKATRVQAAPSTLQSYAFYFHDDWKVTPKLTINFGVRYDLETPFKSKLNDVVSWDQQGGTMLLSERVQNRTEVEAFYRDVRPDIKIRFYPEKTVYDFDKNNFQPRFGMAYRLRDKTVLRTGGGFYTGSPMTAMGTWNNTFAPNYLYPYWGADARSPFISLADGRKLPSSYNPEGPAGGPESTACCGIPQSILPFASRDFPYPTTYQWTMALQHQWTQALMIEASYLGSRTNHLLGYDNLNTVAEPSPEPVQLRLPFPSFNRIQGVTNGLDAWYHGLGAKMYQRQSNGLSYLVSYTWSKSLDTGSTYNNISQWTDPLNKWSSAKGPSTFDVRHRFVASYQYDLPFGRNKRFGNQVSGVVDQVLGGWIVSGITSFQTGFYYDPLMNDGRVNVCSPGYCWGMRADRIRDGNLSDSERTLNRYWDRAAFVLPDYDHPRITNAGRGILKGPGRNNWDMGIYKRFRVGEKTTMEFRYETFNTFNHPQFDAPESSTESALFGVITSAKPPRISQFALKLLF